MASGEGAGTYCREAIEFTVKGPIPIFCEEDKKNVSGCSAIDVYLTKPSRVGEIVFRNYYTASVSVLVQLEKENEQAQARGKHNPWIVAVPKKILMPSAHLEEGSNDLYSLSATESIIDLDKVVMLRLILRQPSPLWNTFRLEEINLFTELPRLGATPTEYQEAQRLLELMRKQTMLALTTLPEYEEIFLESTLTLGIKQSVTVPPPPPPPPMEAPTQTLPYEIQKLPLS